MGVKKWKKGPNKKVGSEEPIVYKEFESWGVSPSYAKYSGGWNCPDCDVEFLLSKIKTESLVGFSRSVPFEASSIVCFKPFAVIFECPKCFENYWWHVDHQYAENLAELFPEKFIEMDKK